MAVELLAVLAFVAFVVYLVGEDRGHRRRDRAQHESDVTAAEAAVASAKTHLRNVKNNPPSLPGFITLLLIVALIIVALLVFGDLLRPRRPSYWRGG